MKPHQIKADLLEQKRDIQNALSCGMSPIHPRTGYDWHKAIQEIDQQLSELQRA